MPMIETARATIHYKDYRQAPDTPPVILIHGAGGMYLDWSITLRRDLGAIALDLPGHGRSPLPGRASIADYAADVVALLDALAIDTATIIGHSMGGAIAQMIALDYPQVVRRLGLIGTGARLPVNAQIISGIVDDTEATAHLLMKWMWARQIDEQVRQQGAQRLLKTSATVIQADFKACDAFDVRERLPQIAVDTRVLVGTDDKMTPLAWSQTLAAAIPQANLITVAGGGHMVVLEQAQVVCDHLRAWLAHD
jgi:pimeloyl-ACP methyl ester carboxylesterase